MEEDRPCPASPSPEEPQPEDDPMSPEGAAQLLQLGAPEDHPAEPLSLSPASLFLNLLRSSEMTEEPYPAAMEGAEESGPAQDPTRPAGQSGVRLSPTLTCHIPHIPGPYRIPPRSHPRTQGSESNTTWQRGTPSRLPRGAINLRPLHHLSWTSLRGGGR